MGQPKKPGKWLEGFRSSKDPEGVQSILDRISFCAGTTWENTVQGNCWREISTKADCGSDGQQLTRKQWEAPQR